MTILRILILILLTSGILFSAQKKDSLINSIVRVTVQYQSVNYYYPWVYRAPQSRSGQGIIIDKNLVLTQAYLVKQARFIECRFGSEPTPLILKPVYVDIDRNIALLSGNLPDSAKKIKIHSNAQLEHADLVNFFWKTDTGRFLEGNAKFDRADSYVYNPSFQSQLWYEFNQPSATGGYGEPVFKGDDFVGISVYGSDSSLTVLSAKVIQKSLKLYYNKNAKTNMMGFKTTPCTQKYLRLKNNLKQSDGGCYVIDTFGQGCGSKTLLKGDLLLKINETPLDAWGRYQHPIYGKINFSHLFSNFKLSDSIEATVIRGGEKTILNFNSGIIEDEKWVIPRYRHGQQSRYFIRGGFIFQNLSLPYLKAWGNEWAKKAPENILRVLEENRYKLKTQEKQEILILSHILAHPLNRGLQYIGRQIIHSVNGKELSGLDELYKLLEKDSDSISLELMPGKTPLLLSPNKLKLIDPEIKRLYNIDKLKNL